MELAARLDQNAKLSMLHRRTSRDLEESMQTLFVSALSPLSCGSEISLGRLQQVEPRHCRTMAKPETGLCGCCGWPPGRGQHHFN